MIKNENVDNICNYLKTKGWESSMVEGIVPTLKFIHQDEGHKFTINKDGYYVVEINQEAVSEARCNEVIELLYETITDLCDVWCVDKRKERYND